VIGWAVVASLALAAPPVPAKNVNGERFVYWIDLERAVLATREGKRIKAEFDEAVEAVENEVQAKETRVYLLRKELEKTGDPATRAKYDTEVEAIDQMITREEKRLDEAQDKKLEPILSALRAIVTRYNRSSGLKAQMIDLSEYPILNGDGACDATTWLVQAYESKKEEGIAPIDQCRAHVFCLVGVDELMKNLEETKKAGARLDAFQKEKQVELDAKQTELKRLQARVGSRPEGRAEYERARIELAARYSAYQKALKDKERAEETKLRGAARALVAEVASGVPGAIFIDAGSLDDATDPKRSEAEISLSPKCDLSTWFIDVAKKAAKPAALADACPEVERGASPGKNQKDAKASRNRRGKPSR
jgi:Skp family chaperone for outer membrane proteins